MNVLWGNIFTIWMLHIWTISENKFLELNGCFSRFNKLANINRVPFYTSRYGKLLYFLFEIKIYYKIKSNSDLKRVSLYRFILFLKWAHVIYNYNLRWEVFFIKLLYNLFLRENASKKIDFYLILVKMLTQLEFW
jgi:hypothetical protein